MEKVLLCNVALGGHLMELLVDAIRRPGAMPALKQLILHYHNGLSFEKVAHLKGVTSQVEGKFNCLKVADITGARTVTLFL